MEILGVSFDSVADNRAFAQKFNFPFRLLSDPERHLALEFGACGDATAKYPKRCTFVIGPDQKILHAIDTQDPAGQADALLELLS